MTMDEILSLMPEYAKDIKINLKNVLDAERSKLFAKQIYIIAVSSSIATKNQKLIDAIELKAKEVLDEKELNAAKGAAVIMGMNNIYYRFTHLSSNKAYSSMPPSLRMQIIANHGIERIDFELASLAVSAINGCGMCMDSHEANLKKEGATEEQIQEAVKIASVVNAAGFIYFL